MNSLLSIYNDGSKNSVINDDNFISEKRQLILKKYQ